LTDVLALARTRCFSAAFGLFFIARDFIGWPLFGSFLVGQKGKLMLSVILKQDKRRGIMFTLPDLEYDYSALAPHISAEIMELHHSKHHQTYVDKLNAALKEHPEWQNKTIEEILTSLDDVPETVRTAVRNNGGGHYNHSLFWQWLSPHGGGQPEGSAAEGLTQKYESFDNFKEKFSEVAAGIFGSGWAWLLPDFSITTTPLQDSPLSRDGIVPILGLDVWEHAYYLDYKNRRPDYIAAWWNIVDWKAVENSFIEK
jgi:Fe-Mn family superoxide dismutase